MTPEYRVQLDVVTQGYDRQTDWFQPRVGIVPPQTAVLTLTRQHLWGSDIFTAVSEMRSEDLGRTWTAPQAHATLDRRALPDGVEACPCDMTPAWHARSGRLLATGHTALYAAGERGASLKGNSHTRDIAWSVYDAASHTWSPWETLPVPDRERFFWTGAGCTQRVDRPDGDVLLPTYSMPRADVGENFWKSCFFSTVMRCAFDGRHLRYIEHGDELTVPDRRGLYEPSLAAWQGRYYLTLRNDLRGYVAVGGDGLHFSAPVPWTFDDGEELGSYNTQQHWIAHSDGLFLVYTRRGADNDFVFRHRAPLFMAQVDPERLCVLRATERAIVPNYGAQLGNFGTANVTPQESWVVTSECMQGKPPATFDDLERRGANARVWLCRILWDRPNRLVEG